MGIKVELTDKGLIESKTADGTSSQLLINGTSVAVESGRWLPNATWGISQPLAAITISSDKCFYMTCNGITHVSLTINIFALSPIASNTIRISNFPNWNGIAIPQPAFIPALVTGNDGLLSYAGLGSTLTVSGSRVVHFQTPAIPSEFGTCNFTANLWYTDEKF